MALRGVLGSIFPVEKPRPQRTERDEADAELLARGEHAVVLDVARPQRVLALNGGDGLDGVGTADRLRARLRQAEVLHLALLNQFLHRAGDVLDEHVGVDAVLIQHVDRRHVQSPQHRVDDPTNVLGAAVQAVARAVGIDPQAELGGDHDLVPEQGPVLRRPVLRS